MSATKLDFNLTIFKDKDGIPRALRGCPITQLLELEYKVTRLWGLLSQYPDLEVLTLYRCHLEIQVLTNDCLQLCGVSPNWLTPDMLIQLLYHYNAEDGEHKGLLIGQNLPHLAGANTVNQLIEQGLTLLEQLELEDA